MQLRVELGDHAAVVAQMPRLIEQNRLEEDLYEVYLLALYRSGRRAEALEAYRMVYDLFDEELGVRPGPRLRALHERMLHDEIDVEPPQTSRSPEDAEFPAVPRPRTRAGETLDGVLDRTRDRLFVGRKMHRAAFQAMLDGHRGGRFAVLFVNASAGMGKTTLLRAFAGMAETAGRPVWYLDAEHAEVSRDVLERLGSELAAAAGPVLLLDPVTWRKSSDRGCGRSSCRGSSARR